MGKTIILFVAFVLVVVSFQNCSLNMNLSGLGFAAGGGNGDGYTGIIYFSAKGGGGGWQCTNASSNPTSVIKFENHRFYLITPTCGETNPIDITSKIKWIGNFEAIEYDGIIYTKT